MNPMLSLQRTLPTLVRSTQNLADKQCKLIAMTLEKRSFSSTIDNIAGNIRELPNNKNIKPIHTPIDLKKLCAGDRYTLAKAITLVESRIPEHQKQAQKMISDLASQGHMDNNRSVRLGISGPPGVGKSTFIEAFGTHITQTNSKVAVLAVDPSSSLSGGSILGDKTRMEQLTRNPDAFIRPSPSRGELGGVTQATRASILLCEAAGFDFIIVETVGAGQSEVDVANITDFFAVLAQPYGGDGLQGIKKGILEVADFVLINKADGDLVDAARRACKEYESAFQLTHSMVPHRDRPIGEKGMSRSPHQKQVLACSSITGDGIERIQKAIEKRWQSSLREGTLTTKRQDQAVRWMDRLVVEQLPWRLQQEPLLAAEMRQLKQKVALGSITVEASVEQLYNFMLGSFRPSSENEPSK